MNLLLSVVTQLTDDRVTEIENALALTENLGHVVAASITFNPNSGKILDGYKLSSLTDCGTLDFIVGFASGLGKYVFSCYGSGPVSIKQVSEAPTGMRIVFQSPAPDKVTVAFFEEQPNISLERTRGR